MHNLGTVYRFEIIRTLKKKSFWITALGLPIIMIIIFFVIFLSNKSTDDIASKLKDQKFTVAYTDESGLIKPDIAKAIKAKSIASSDKEDAVRQVTSGKLDAYFYYPKDISKDKPEVYGKDVGLFNNSRYESVAEALLSQSVSQDVSKSVQSVVGSTVEYKTTTYKHGAPYDGFKELIAPAVFLVLFYFIIAFFGNQMLTSTTEEKENRVIEMILTTIKANTLILGKILSLLSLVVIQLVTILLPVIVVYLLFGSNLSLPNIDLSQIPLDPLRIGIGAGIFVLSLLMFTGLLIAVGAAAPTAKEAGSFFGMIMIFIFGPLYAVTLFVSAPESALVQFLSYFPFTAPIPLMLRNAVGNLSVPEALLGMGILTITAIIVFMIAVRLFRFGALEYNRKLGIKDVLASRKS